MSTFSILSERNNLTITEKEEVKLNPISQYEFITCPLNEELPILAVDKDIYLGLLLKAYQFTENLDGVEPFDRASFNNFMLKKLNLNPEEKTAEV